jgi:hypothetical protein
MEIYVRSISGSGVEGSGSMLFRIKSKCAKNRKSGFVRNRLIVRINRMQAAGKKSDSPGFCI